ncbi:MAG: hypothetical protein HY717_14745 [Planctomycetes bacterium]|nr:hypothetical protein [Planctomycetota bacterium]
MACLALAALPAPADKPAAADDELRLKIGDPAEWQFVGGVWITHPEGELSPPAEAVDEHVAFYLPRTYGDFEAEFEFRLDLGFSDAGFIFHAQDAQHYSMVHFP